MQQAEQHGRDREGECAARSAELADDPEQDGGQRQAEQQLFDDSGGDRESRAEPDAAAGPAAQPAFRFDVEPDDDDVDEGDRFRPRGTRPVTSDFPDFDQLLNPRSDD